MMALESLEIICLDESWLPNDLFVNKPSQQTTKQGLFAVKKVDLRKKLDNRQKFSLIKPSMDMITRKMTSMSNEEFLKTLPTIKAIAHLMNANPEALQNIVTKSWNGFARYGRLQTRFAGVEWRRPRSGG